MNRSNNFNILRLLASILVLWGHCFPLTGAKHDPVFLATGYSAGQIAVDLFFIVSGYLIFTSLQRARTLLDFVIARSLRIYPGLWAMLAVTSVCYLVSSGLEQGTAMQAVWDYCLKNLHLLSTRLAYELPGWFEQNPYPGAVNGSLWTLPWELRMYMALAAIGLAPSALRPLMVFAVAIASGSWHIAAEVWPNSIQPTPAGPLFRFLWFFFAGSAIAAISARAFSLVARWAPLIASASLLPFGLGVLSSTYATYAILLPIAVIWLGTMPSHAAWSHLMGSSDISYGVYLYAFPVQQATAALVPHIRPLEMFAITLPLVVGLAALSWRVIERPALSMRQRLVRHG